MKAKNIAVTAVFAIILFALTIASLLLPDEAVSRSERRKLAQLTSYSEAAEGKADYSLSNYFSYLEDYLLDQFPERDVFRSVKSVFKLELLRQKDNNGYYYADGTLCKTDEKLNYAAVNDSIGSLNRVYQRYFADSGAKVYYALIPDKNYFTAQPNGYPAYDYAEFFSLVGAGLDENIQRLDVMDTITLDDYYRTDPHWSQTNVLDTADKLLGGMGAAETASGQSYEKQSLSPFYGTYYGQAALPVQPDTLEYLTNDELSACVVYNYETGKTESVYNGANFENTDPYDVFLGGASALLRVTNPAQDNGRQLVLFRDSFGSSIAPLLIPAYEEIIIVDIRYVSLTALGSFIEFSDHCDVLFLYSTSVLNSMGAFLR